jgi:hypothetical protein
MNNISAHSFGPGRPLVECIINNRNFRIQIPSLDWKEPNRIAEAVKNKLFPVVEEWVPSALKMVGQYETSCGWLSHELAGKFCKLL